MSREHETPPSLIGEYRVEGRIGAGGMGVVHLAVSPSGRRVALKIIRGDFVDDPDYRTRFRQEIDAARQVSGAFTAPVLSADPDGDPPWMATQYFDAPTLARRLEETGSLDENAVRRLGRGLAEALRDIHRAGLVHRDLKPGNVLLTEDGPRVIDFGIARVLNAEPITRTSKILGTVSFMSPEQLSDPRQVGPAADVFALGAVLVYAATGRGPFDGHTGTPPIGVAMKIVHEDPDLRDVPPALRSVVERCLSKDAADRPLPAELLLLLRQEEATPEGAAGPESPAQLPAPIGPTPGRPGRRSTRMYASAAVVAVALTGVLAWNLFPDGASGTNDPTPGASTSSPGRGSTPPDAKGTDRITIAVSGDRPGLGQKLPNGGFAGFEVDVATYVAGELGYAPADIVWQEAPSAARLALLAQDRADFLAASFAVTPSRSREVDFSAPYLTAHQDVLLPGDAPDIREPSDLRGSRVCALEGSTAFDTLTASVGPGAVPVARTSVAQCVDALAKGEVDAVTADDTTLAAHAASRETHTFKLAGLALGEEPYAIGLPKGSPLTAEVTKALGRMKADGSLDRALRKNLLLLAL
ncbi:serine/threonine-protein kinase [Streptomyces sp. NPDC058653]|uniref:serine/threonine-protein kinase n=1 Tax=Streptomyces sp. NPDC058653 TaxID=3346576 RepID=UPI003656F195